jgi:hypothetical protein
MSVLEWLLCIFCGFVGCIMGIVYLTQGKKKGTKMIIVSIAVAIVCGIVEAILVALAGPHNLPVAH